MRRTMLVTPSGSRLPLRVPETEAERTIGMNAGSPRPWSGMVFNFDPPTTPVMTMEETPMALQIAFVGPDRVVHTVYQAPPYSGLYASTKPTRWVIETFLVWNVLKVGDRVRFAVG